jgi:hypothetical protein
MNQEEIKECAAQQLITPEKAEVIQEAVGGDKDNGEQTPEKEVNPFTSTDMTDI